MAQSQTITPAIMAGGSGTRLWPLSRKSYPKQFAKLIGDRPLFQQAAQRLTGALFYAPIVVTGNDFRFVVTEQLTDAGLDPATLPIESEARNTAAPLLATALHLLARDPYGAMLVAPADHIIPDAERFRQIVARGLAATEAGLIITFGITPSRAETGCGYLELTSAVDGLGGPEPLPQFVEKPDAADADKKVASGRHLFGAASVERGSRSSPCGGHSGRLRNARS